jgi:predicted heme/steroid binding protein
MSSYILYILVITVPAAFLIYRHNHHRLLSPSIPAEDLKKPVKSIMQPPRDDLLPPKDDLYTTEELKQYDGSDPSKPIYVAIKGSSFFVACCDYNRDNEYSAAACLTGYIFDVTHKTDSYGPGKSYNVFAGKDGSRGLGKSSLKVEDAVADYSVLDEKERKVLDDWHAFFLYVAAFVCVIRVP